MCLVVGGGGSGAGWLPAGGIRASQVTFSSYSSNYGKLPYRNPFI